MTKKHASIQELVHERPRLAALFSGEDLSLSPNYRNTCVQSDYARLHLQNAVDLLKGSVHLDFAVPGALFLLRQGIELWLKCIVSNLELDEILALIVRNRPSFRELSEHEVVSRGKAMYIANQNKIALSRGLCAFRSMHVDGLRAPTIWTERNEGEFPDQAVQAVADRSGFCRETFGVYYIPRIGGHDLRKLWIRARAEVAARRKSIDRTADAGGFAAKLDLDLLDDLVELLSYLDPDGDALRYPFSIRQEWHDRMPPMSRPWLSAAIEHTMGNVVNERLERSERYSLTTIGGTMQMWFRPPSKT